jgi:hypothetical protein
MAGTQPWLYSRFNELNEDESKFVSSICSPILFTMHIELYVYSYDEINRGVKTTILKFVDEEHKV